MYGIISNILNKDSFIKFMHMAALLRESRDPCHIQITPQQHSSSLTEN